jgi:hypothetical protein
MPKKEVKRNVDVAVLLTMLNLVVQEARDSGEPPQSWSQLVRRACQHDARQHGARERLWPEDFYKYMDMPLWSFIEHAARPKETR